jgi:hypothetical protein
MKRSGQVGLAVMGVVAFAGTYAAVAAYRAGTSSSASQPQSAAQTCTTRPDGTQSCEPARRGFSYYLIPSFMHGASSAAASTPRPQAAAFASHAPAPASHAAVPAAKVQPAAPTASMPAAAAKPPGTLTYIARPTTSASTSSAQRGGFGTTAQSNSSSRVSAGG